MRDTFCRKRLRSRRRTVQGGLPRFETLEKRLALTVSAAEQYFVYALNRARHNPVAYQHERSLAIDLSYVSPQPPLAINAQLMNSSEFKSSEMASLNYFSHTSVTGETPNQLARRFGYDLPSTLMVGSTTYVIGVTGNQIESLAAGYATAELALEGLIVDEGVSPPGHRNHLLGIEPFYAAAREIGVGYAANASAFYGHYWSVHATQSTDEGPYLTGVAFADSNADNRFNEHEGVGSVTITANGPAGTFTTSTLGSGGWSMKVPTGQYIVTASGGSWAGVSSAAITVGTANVEVDFISGQSSAWVDFSRYVNSAPALSASGGRNLSPVVIGVTPPGSTVSSLLGTSFSDGNPLASSGIAITAATVGTASGVWEYSVDGGVTWSALGSPSVSASRLLRQQDLVRFVPSLGSQPGSASLTYRAWDQTTGTAGGTASTATVGGSSAFSSTSATASAATIAANTAPILSPSGSGVFDPVLEDAVSPAGSTVAKIMGTAFSDVDPGTSPGLALVDVTGTANGVWAYSTDAGATWLPIGGVSDSSALLLRSSDRLRFVPAANYWGSESVRYRGWDQSAGVAGTLVDLSAGAAVGGSTAFSSVTATAAITISPVNDAPAHLEGRSALRMRPIAVNSAFNFIGTTVSEVLGNCVLDPDASPLTGIALIGLGSGGTFYWSTNGSSWSGGTVSPTFVTLLRSSDRIGFAPNSGFTGDTTVNFRLWDQTTGTAGFNQANLSNPSVSTGGTTAFGSDVLTARLFVGAAGAAPTATFGSVTRAADGRKVESIPINFSRSVTGLDAGDFTLTRDGAQVSLTNATLIGSGTSFVLSGLASSTVQAGTYTLALKTSQTGIADSAGTPVSGTVAANFAVAAPASPTDIILSSTTIAENAGENAVVGVLTTSDPDTSSGFTYALVTGTGGADNASFNISGNQLRASVSLDFEAKNSYVIRVRSTDPDGLSVEKSFSITVADVNEGIYVAPGEQTVDPAIRSGTFTLVKQGAGVLILDKANAHSGGTIVEAGELIVRNVSALGSGRLDVRPGAKVTLDIGAVTWNGGGNYVQISQLQLDPLGRIELGVGQIRVAAGNYDLAAIRAALLAGRNGGLWNGTTGFTSASAGQAISRAVGYRVVPASSELRMGFAAHGDTNLDGQVSFTDVSLINNGGKFGQGKGSNPGWSEGDFNYSGDATFTDVTLLNNAVVFGKGLYVPPTPAGSSSDTTTVEPGFIDLDIWAAYAFALEPRTVMKKR